MHEPTFNILDPSGAALKRMRIGGIQPLAEAFRFVAYGQSNLLFPEGESPGDLLPIGRTADDTLAFCADWFGCIQVAIGDEPVSLHTGKIADHLNRLNPPRRLNFNDTATFRRALDNMGMIVLAGDPKKSEAATYWCFPGSGKYAKESLGGESWYREKIERNDKRTRNQKTPGWVYCLSDEAGPIFKIGKSIHDPRSTRGRRRHLQTGNGRPLGVIAAAMFPDMHSTEHLLKYMHRDKLTATEKEWFHLSMKDVDFVTQCLLRGEGFILPDDLGSRHLKLLSYAEQDRLDGITGFRAGREVSL